MEATPAEAAPVDLAAANDADERWARLKPDVKAKLMKYVKDSGWLRSVLKEAPVDKLNQHIPWYTFGCINFLSARMIPGLSVFEFGSGASTLWWAAKAAHVTSVETDRKWFDRINRRLPANVTYSHIPLVRGGDYCQAAERADRKFDVVVVDGKDRLKCGAHTPAALSERGVIIWDNSERERYQPGLQALLALGFRKVEFAGNGPLNTSPWETSIFYRPGNWLDL